MYLGKREKGVNGLCSLNFSSLMIFQKFSLYIIPKYLAQKLREINFSFRPYVFLLHLWGDSKYNKIS